jgi:hypothetical protein
MTRTETGRLRALPMALLVTAVIAGAAAAQNPPKPPTSAPVPEPFPHSSQPQRAAPQTPPPVAPAGPTAQPAGVPGRPSEATLGAPIYPAAEFLDSFDAGYGQRYYLFGTNAPYVDIVQYYKNTLKGGGRELLKAPPMQQFDLGKFQESAMAYPPSIVVKDYTWNGSLGYLYVTGTTEKRFKTVIQIVPTPAR